MGDFSSVIDLIIFFSGLYILYSVISMKTSGEINSVLLSKEMDIKKCKDLEGYKRFLFPRSLVMGIMTVVFGAAGLVNVYVVRLGSVYTALVVVLMVVLIWYFVDYRRGIKRFWGE
ncbi:MAG: hypothetical protein HFI31_11470 [Lachnospiraceae bacterium]|jgi:hypothetical protein|nr:hypothetical protein [Lachnospiraceae bacterium]MCI8994821.1 hypothetical protein [Lachnospiraceae bacterium]MCI9134785.1 hypothetical protein [Lachnospiraceae bacterium]